MTRAPENERKVEERYSDPREALILLYGSP